MRPEEIERESMRIIGEEMGAYSGEQDNLTVIKRVIHTTADFDFKDKMVFSEKAVQKAREALSSGVTVVTDTQMAAAGINKIAAKRFGIEVVCRMSNPEIREEAAKRQVTRAVVSMEEAVRQTPNAISRHRCSRGICKCCRVKRNSNPHRCSLYSSNGAKGRLHSGICHSKRPYVRNCLTQTDSEMEYPQAHAPRRPQKLLLYGL